jgi:hypothetical protein
MMLTAPNKEKKQINFKAVFVLYLGIHFNDSTDTQLPGVGSQILPFNF